MFNISSNSNQNIITSSQGEANKTSGPSSTELASFQGKEMLQQLADIQPANGQQILSEISKQVCSSPEIQKELAVLEQKYPDHIREIREGGKGWIERKKEYRENPGSCPEFEKSWYQFREEVCAIFQKCANITLQKWGIEPISWNKYGTDSALSDIDLIAFSENGTHSTEELVIATQLMNILAANLFSPSSACEKQYVPSTSFLFDWETYVPHHANFISENDFHTTEGRNKFQLIGLQLAIMQIHKNALPEQWDQIKQKIILHTPESMKNSIAQLIQDIEQFRAAQEKDEIDFVGESGDSSLSQLFLTRSATRAAKKAQEAQDRIQALEKQLQSLSNMNDPNNQNQIAALKSEIDEARIALLLNYAIIESKQEGGQYSYGAYEVICRKNGSQRHKQSISQEQKRLQQAQHAKNASLRDLSFHSGKLSRKHPASTEWEHLLSAVENGGFLCHEKDAISGSKYLERTYSSLKLLQDENASEASPEIDTYHKEAHELLSVKRDVDLHPTSLENELKALSEQTSKRNKNIMAHIPLEAPEINRLVSGGMSASPKVMLACLEKAIQNADPKFYEAWQKDPTIRNLIYSNLYGSWENMRSILSKAFFSETELSSEQISETVIHFQNLKNEEGILDPVNAMEAARTRLNSYQMWSIDPDVQALTEGFFLPKAKQSSRTRELISRSQNEIKSRSPKVKQPFQRVLNTTMQHVCKIIEKILEKRSDLAKITFSPLLHSTWNSVLV